MSERTAESAEWAFQVAAQRTPAAPTDFDRDRRLDDAWGALVQAHMPFRVPDDECRSLIDALRAIERLVIQGGASPPVDLATYFGEAYLGPASGASDWQVRYLVLLQARLMEQAFQSLRLDRYANAPTNRGWMNLFRSWARAPGFMPRFAPLERFFTIPFLRFFYNFVLDREPIDSAPVPHPWDPRRRPITPPLPRFQVPATMPGVYLDSGIIEAGETPAGGDADTKERAADANIAAPRQSAGDAPSTETSGAAAPTTPNQ